MLASRPGSSGMSGLTTCAHEAVTAKRGSGSGRGGWLCGWHHATRAQSLTQALDPFGTPAVSVGKKLLFDLEVCRLLRLLIADTTALNLESLRKLIALAHNIRNVRFGRIEADAGSILLAKASGSLANGFLKH